MTGSAAPRPTSPEALVEQLADFVVDRFPQRVRLAVDGAPYAAVELVTPLADALRQRGRPVVCVDTGDFLRAASLRLERGHHDSDAYYDAWYDLAALRREVLDPLHPDGSGRYLPTLWDPVRDRATRAAYESAPANAVALVRGPFLLRLRDAFDRTVALWLSPAARARRVPAENAARDLPAYERYEREHAPFTSADVAVRCDDPRRPAVVWRR